MYRLSVINASKYNDASPVSLHALHSIAFLDIANSHSTRLRIKTTTVTVLLTVISYVNDNQY